MGARQIRREIGFQRRLRIRWQSGCSEPGGHPLLAAQPAVRHLADLHAPGLHAATAADAARHGRTRRARVVCRQPVCPQRHRTDHGKRGGRSCGLRAPCPGSLGLRKDRHGRLVGRGVSRTVLPVAGRKPHCDPHSGGRRVQHHGRQPPTCRRVHFPGSTPVTCRGADRLDRPFGAG